MKKVYDFWSNIMDMIEDEAKSISELGYSTWVKTIIPFSFEKNVLTLSVPLEINKEMIEKRYLSLIKSAANIINKEDTQVIIKLEEELENIANTTQSDNLVIIDDEVFVKSNLNKKYIFNNFVIGESNRFASAAAKAVADNPAKSYNPLFIYGDVGLGKTHLMQAIGNQILKSNANSKILYISSEIFTNGIIDAIRNNTTNEFRDKYRNLDVLIIDDIQFIAGKVSTQDEFFHTFNHLHQGNKQIIISSDRPPKDISSLEDRLRSRFESGLICDIKQPDYETRVAILKKKVQDENLDISDDLLQYIAERVKSNIRELEGVLNKLIAHSHLGNEKITKSMIEDVVKDISNTKVSKALNIDSIIYEVANYYDIDPKILKSKTRKQEITIIRQVAMYVIKSVTDISLAKIGEEFGGRDHSTVINSINKIEQLIKEDEPFKNNIETIISTIKNML